MVVRTSRGITPRITSAVNMLSTFTNSTRFSGVRFSVYRRSASASFKRHIPSIVSESGHSWDIVPSPYPSCRVATSPQTGVRVNYHVGQGPTAISAHIGRDLWAASPLVQFPSGGQRKSLLSLPASLLSIAFAGQRLLDTEFLPRLQEKGVSLDFPDNVLLQNLPLEVAGSARAPSCRVGSGSGKKNAHRRTKGCRFGLH